MLVRMDAARATRLCEAQDRMEDGLLFWKVLEDGWGVATPDGLVLVEELLSWVDCRSRRCRRRVVVLQGR